MEINFKFPVWKIKAELGPDKRSSIDYESNFEMRALTAEDACFQIRCFYSVKKWISIELTQ